MSPERTAVSDRVSVTRDRIDDMLRSFVAGRRRALAEVEPAAAVLVDEIADLIEAGGKRLRPAFCVVGFRASAAPEADDRVLPVAAALELLHVMAIVHDDVMDGSFERRGRPTVEVRQAELARQRGMADAARVGRSVAVLVGDLAAAFAEELFLSVDVAPDRLADVLGRYHSMRLDMAAGQFLDVAAPNADPRRAATLKGGSYTVSGPLLIGAALGGASPRTTAVLQAYATPLGEAFQLADDLRDGEAPPTAGPEDVRGLVERARRELDTRTLATDVIDDLSELAHLIARMADPQA